MKLYFRKNSLVNENTTIYLKKKGKNATILKWHKCSADTVCLYPEELTTTVLSHATCSLE